MTLFHIVIQHRDPPISIAAAIQAAIDALWFRHFSRYGWLHFLDVHVQYLIIDTSNAG